jgi:DnaK suppressor protein
MSSHPDFLTAEFLERQRRSLLSLRAALLDASKTNECEESQVNEAAAGGPHEYEDDGQKLAALETAGNLVARYVARLARVNRALEKITDGTYGLSDVSRSPIPHDRLNAIPDAICTLDEEAGYELGQGG